MSTSTHRAKKPAPDGQSLGGTAQNVENQRACLSSAMQLQDGDTPLSRQTSSCQFSCQKLLWLAWFLRRVQVGGGRQERKKRSSFTICVILASFTPDVPTLGCGLVRLLRAEWSLVSSCAWMAPFSKVCYDASLKLIANVSS